MHKREWLQRFALFENFETADKYDRRNYLVYFKLYLFKTLNYYKCLLNYLYYKWSAGGQIHEKTCIFLKMKVRILSATLLTYNSRMIIALIIPAIKLEWKLPKGQFFCIHPDYKAADIAYISMMRNSDKCTKRYGVATSNCSAAS